MPFWPRSRMRVDAGALLALGYIDPDPSSQCQGKTGAASTNGADSPVTERTRRGPRSMMSGATDAKLVHAKSSRKRRRTQQHQRMMRAHAAIASGRAAMG